MLMYWISSPNESKKSYIWDRFRVYYDGQVNGKVGKDDCYAIAAADIHA